jgi:hypothetical protein
MAPSELTLEALRSSAASNAEAIAALKQSNKQLTGQLTSPVRLQSRNCADSSPSGLDQQRQVAQRSAQAAKAQHDKLVHSRVQKVALMIFVMDRNMPLHDMC